MKTTFIIVSLFIVSSTIIFPQLKNGSFLVGGGFTGKIESFDNSNYSRSGTTLKEFTFFPNAGYFVLENIAVGLTARIGLTDYESNYSNTSKTTEFYFRYGVGPFFRYYYPVGDFAFIGELKYEWALEQGEQERNGITLGGSKSESDRHNNIFSSGLGISYFFNKYVSIESMLRYEIENITYSSRTIESNYPLEDYESETEFKRFLFVIGLQIYFPTE